MASLKWPPKIHGLLPHDALWYLLVRKRADGIPLSMCDYSRFILLKEWAMWKECYLPPEGVKGATVLDVGAGCGESAYFYFQHGAKRVVAIEPNRECARNYRLNAQRNHWDTVLFERPFQLSDVTGLDFDMVKMDCEGGEEALLPLQRLPRGTYEVHGRRLIALFKERFGAGAKWVRVNRKVSIMFNW